MESGKGWVEVFLTPDCCLYFILHYVFGTLDFLSFFREVLGGGERKLQALKEEPCNREPVCLIRCSFLSVSGCFFGGPRGLNGGLVKGGGGVTFA